VKFSLCIDIFYFDPAYMGADTKNMLKGMDIAKEAGFDAIEFWNWWQKDVDKIAAKAKETGLVITAICQKFITLGDPAARGEYLDALKETIAAAKKLGVKRVISQTGFDDVNVAYDDFRRSLIDGLKASVPLLEEADITLVVEPLNVLVDHGGYWLVTSEQSFDIMREVGSPRVKILFDVYHQQISEGNIIRNITDNVAMIGHIHAAGNPGRNELWQGEINYPEVFRAIDATGYEGYVGLEYLPTLGVEDSIKKTRKYLIDNGF
jgi:hydroxypyruvate isomerase